MRYWSVCENEFATQRYVACSADEDTMIDSLGFFTVVVSDAADRPINAVRTNDITWLPWGSRSEEHTSELQSLMRISYAVFCLKNKNTQENKHKQNTTYEK